MASCETCRWRRGYAVLPNDNPEFRPRVGWCRHDTPRQYGNDVGWPMVHLMGWCRLYRFSLLAWWRKGKEG